MSRYEVTLREVSLQDAAEALRAVMVELRAHEDAVISEDDVRVILTAGLRALALYGREHDARVAPLEHDVSPTDAVVTACALLRAFGLNPFDLALWFDRARPAD